MRASPLPAIAAAVLLAATLVGCPKKTPTKIPEREGPVSCEETPDMIWPELARPDAGTPDAGSASLPQ